MEELVELSNLIDDVKEKLKNDEYLALMDKVKDVSESLVNSKVVEQLRNVLLCPEHIKCVCDLSTLIDRAIDEIIQSHCYQRVLAKVMCERYLRI